MTSITQLTAAWEHFFHAPQSLFPLALFRLLFGIIVFLNGVLLFRCVPRHLAVDAIFSFDRYGKRFWRWRLSLLNILPATTVSVYFLIAVSCVAGICLAIGVFSKLAAIACFLTLVSLHHRNPAIHHGGDTVMRIMAFLMMFAPVGAGWSVDAWQTENWEATGDPWCLRLMQLQVSIIYLRNTFWKLRGKEWRNGTAAWYPANCNSYTRFKLPAALLSLPLLRTATWGTLTIEFALGTAIWIDELRLPVMLAGICLHLMLEVVMNLQLFGWTMIACLLLFC